MATTAQAAALLGLSASQTTRLAHAGHIPGASKPGRDWVFEPPIQDPAARAAEEVAAVAAEEGPMTAVTFDTLKYAEALKSAGVPDAQAKTQAQALADALRQGGQDLATKADIAELKADIIKWNVGALIAMTGVFTTIVKLL